MKNENEKKVDDIMKIALASDLEPEDALNRSILCQWKESTVMLKRRRIPVIATAALCLLLTSATVFAAVRYLKPAEIADKIGNDDIAAAFEGEHAIEINESQEAGDYRFTLLGITKGEMLIQSALTEAMPNLKSTYAAVAIERLDKTPMPNTSEAAYGQLKFFISPLIEGLNPNQYNIVTMNGGYSDVVVDGILYRIIECSDIEKFADRNLYLCISDSTFFQASAYQYDENSGNISRSEGYEGINLLFDLPLDPAQADAAAVEDYLKALEEANHAEEEAVDDETEHANAGETYIMKLSDKLNAAMDEGNIEGKLVEEGFEVLSTETAPKKDDGYEFQYKVFEGSEPSSTFIHEEFFTEGVCYSIYSEGAGEGGNEIDTVSVSVFVENEDDTATVTTYKKDMK